MLIFDEVSAGFRENLGGRHLLLNCFPDMCTFAKAFSNGFAMAALLGTRDVMSAAQTSFISSSYWTERIGPAAALATIKKMEKLDVFIKLRERGALVREGWTASAKRHGLKVTMNNAQPTWPSFGFQYDADHGQDVDRTLRTLFKQEMLKR